MTLKKQTLAMCISLALIGTLTACSGSKNNSSPAPSSQKVSELKTPQDQNAEKLKVVVDPNSDWRQFSGFISSSDTSANNPLQGNQNGEISSQLGAAAYLNGDASYQDGESIKDFRKQADRDSTNYNPNALREAKVAPNDVQQLVIQNKSGQTVANIHFINQPYSSFMAWKSVAGSDTIMNGYVAVPTRQELQSIESKGTVTYRGHTLAQKAPNSNEIHKGSIELVADFGKKIISGKLTNRNDMLLDASIKRHYPDIYETYTTDPDEAKEDKTLKLLSDEQFALEEEKWDKALEAKQEQYRTAEITINPTALTSGTGNTITFSSKNDALSYKDGETTRNTGVIGGIFAGDNAQEVVGEIQGGSNFMSFGATEATK